MTDIDPQADLVVHFAGEHMTVKVPLAGPVTGEWLQHYQRLLELITLIHVGAGAQLPDQLHQGLLGSAVPRVVQHLLERVQVVIELHTASVTDPTDIRERFGASRGGEVGFPLCAGGCWAARCWCSLWPPVHRQRVGPRGLGGGGRRAGGGPPGAGPGCPGVAGRGDVGERQPGELGGGASALGRARLCGRCLGVWRRAAVRRRRGLRRPGRRAAGRRGVRRRLRRARPAG